MAIIEHYLRAAENCKGDQRRAISKDSLIIEELYWNGGFEELYRYPQEFVVALPTVGRCFEAAIAAAIRI